MTNRAIFLDKDGTLLKDVPYNVDPRLMRLSPRDGDALRLLAPHYRLIVVSNQSGVARGYFAESALKGVESRLKHLLAEHGATLTAFYYCPHHPRGQVAAYRRRCQCRKPQPGMLLQAAAEHGIDLGRSWMVGDTLDDVEAGRRAGCRTILIENGGLIDGGAETDARPSDNRRPHATVPTTCLRPPSLSWQTPSP